MNRRQHYWKDWRLHVLVLAIVAICELIGPFDIPLGVTSILLLPVVYGVVLGLLAYFTPMVGKKQAKNSEPMVFISVAILIAKFGTEAGPALPKIIAAGPALVLQELGNLGTIFLSLPLAVMLGLRREAIGMTHSIGRESNMALITEKFGIESPEWRGVMSMYIFGTIFGAIFFSIFSGLIASIIPLHPLAYAMATGVGSGVMSAAAVGPIIEMFPNYASDIKAFSGVSNLLTSVTGLYMGILVALPLTIRYYNGVMKLKAKLPKTTKGKRDVHETHV